MNTLVSIGMYALCFLSGSFLWNALVHITWAFSGEKRSGNLKNTFMDSHIGNAAAGNVYLLIGVLILALTGYRLGVNLSTLLLVLGAGMPSITVALRLDRREKNSPTIRPG